MQGVNRNKATRESAKPLTRLLAGAILAAWLATPSLAGQASGSFNVSITFVPAETSCSAAVNAGVPLVSCATVGPLSSSIPAITLNSSDAAASPTTVSGIVGQDGVRLRLPDTRVRVVGAPVGVREEDTSAWGEYSSRLIASGSIEYLEMTVTW